MIPVWLTWKLVERIGPYVLIAAACLGAYFWIHGMQRTIAADKAQITTLQTGLASEKEARAKDVAGLTTLAQGTAAAAVATQKDATILTETISAQNPAPSSPALAEYLSRLREADSVRAVRDAAPGIGSAPAK